MYAIDFRAQDDRCIFFQLISILPLPDYFFAEITTRWVGAMFSGLKPIIDDGATTEKKACL